MSIKWSLIFVLIVCEILILIFLILLFFVYKRDKGELEKYYELHNPQTQNDDIFELKEFEDNE
jgi:hypothetical protein